MSTAALQHSIKTISRQRKDLLLSENFNLLKKRILIFTQCNNLNSKDFDELRSTLLKSKIQVKYLKTSVFRRALKDTPQYSQLLEALTGPVVALSSDQEPGEAGKALMSAIKGKQNIHFIAGKIEDNIWTNEGCSDALQNLEKKSEVLARLLGLLQAPASAITSILSQAPNILVYLLNIQSKIFTPSETEHKD